jgi:ubiquitin carboxyl-terminal hydrolase 4/11/15
MVNWCNDVVKNELNESLFRLTLNHISLKAREDESNDKTLDECLNMFVEKEDLGEQNQIMCGNCKKHQNFYKKFDLERLPPVLILVPKRFKFTKVYRTKIDSYIDFPLYDLDLTPYLAEKIGNDNKYDLFGVIVRTILNRTTLVRYQGVTIQRQ